MWEHYLEILSDPAHLLVEVTLMLVVDVLFMGIALPFLVPYVRRLVRKHDRQVHNLPDPNDLGQIVARLGGVAFVERVIHEYAEEAQRIYDERSAGEYTYSAVMTAAIRDLLSLSTIPGAQPTNTEESA